MTVFRAVFGTPRPDGPAGAGCLAEKISPHQDKAMGRAIPLLESCTLQLGRKGIVPGNMGSGQPSVQAASYGEDLFHI